MGADAGTRLTPRVDQLALPLDPDQRTGYRYYGQYRGSTGNLPFLSCHVSALAQGHSPHLPHTHPEEEILIMLAGEADLILPQFPSSGGRRDMRLTPGQFVYYPAHFPHTLRAVTAQPANYLMFKWRGTWGSRRNRMPFGRFDAADFTGAPGAARPLHSATVFEAPTKWLGRLQAHVSTMAPGGGFEPHIDEHDAAIVVLQGEIEALGHRVRAHGLILFVAGHLHGIHNPGSRPALYVVFEFNRRETFLRKVTDPRRWKRKLRTALSIRASVT
jgi:quercetin dioxygenase-like cupin family protein